MVVDTDREFRRSLEVIEPLPEFLSSLEGRDVVDAFLVGFCLLVVVSVPDPPNLKG